MNLDCSASLLILLGFLAPCSIGYRCTFPRVWEGEYFHLGYSHSLVVSNTTITEKGECTWNSGSQYVVEGRDEERGERCFKCLSIYRKHSNVLQYKESYCETHFENFESLCMGIAGDSPMYSMIRRTGSPEPCPFHGPHTFTYAKGGSAAQCSFPRSYLDSCSDRTKLQLSFQACTDVQGSETSSEQLTCLAGWKEGSKHYLLGEVSRQHVYTDEQKYRCFVYEYHGKGAHRVIRMAESMSASCKGLWSPLEGFRTFEIKKVLSAGAECRYPTWFTGPRSWTSLTSEISVHAHTSHGFKVENLQDTVDPENSFMSCHSAVREDDTTSRVVSYVKSNCDSGFVCTEFNRLTDGVLEARFGPKARNPTEACSSLYFSPSVMKSVLLVSRRSKPEPCPLSGRYQLVRAAGEDSVYSWSESCAATGAESLELSAGCGSSHIHLEASCGSGNRTKQSFTCHAHWTKDGQQHLVLSRAESTLCLSYADKLATLSGETCGGRKPAFTMSETAPCLQALSSQPTSASPVPDRLAAAFIPIMILFHVGGKANL